MLTGDSRLQPRTQDVAATVLDGEVVMINLSTGMYYSMSGTGGIAWELIAKGYALNEVGDAIAEQYGVPVERGRSDVAALAEQLFEENLVVLSSDDPPPATTPPSCDGPRSGYVAPTLEIYRDIGHLVALDPPMPGLTDLPWKEPGDASDRRPD